MINKMPGLGRDKFSNLKRRLHLHDGPSWQEAPVHGPGFGQLHEWDERFPWTGTSQTRDNSQELQNYVKDLLHLYKSILPLPPGTNDWNGSSGLMPMTATEVSSASIRWDGDTGKKNLDVHYKLYSGGETYRVGVPKRG